MDEIYLTKKDLSNNSRFVQKICQKVFAQGGNDVDIKLHLKIYGRYIVAKIHTNTVVFVSGIT